MFDLINEKWDEILEILKKEHDIMDVSFNTWIKPLKIHSVEDNIITLLIPDDNIGISYLNKKYYVPLKVVIHEVTGHAFDIVFSHVSDLNKVEKAIASNKVVSDSLNDRKTEANINPNYTFDNFVVGGNNNFAHAYALAVAESPAEMYNPLFIYGGVGLGKTHLMHSIGNFILDRNPNANIRCVTSEVFTNEVIGAIRSENQSSIV